MKTIVITGISGILGSALGRYYIQQGWKVIGVSRNSKLKGDYFTELCVNRQESVDDARTLFSYEPNLIILCSGQIETEIGEKGLPLQEQLDSITRINYIFPSTVGLQASYLKPKNPLEVVAIGSIADGSPSCFGPVYHASKIALHYFYSGVGPIACYANPAVRLRLYRPGAIKGPLAWAPVNRLNEKGYKIRAKRVNGAPEGDQVARKIAKWIEKEAWVGTYKEPFTFKIFKYIFVLVPNFFYKLQSFGWRKGSKFV